MLKISEYSDVVSFGGIYFGLGNVRSSLKQSTTKTNIGKTYIEKDYLRNANDRILQISGIITGLSRTAVQTLSQAIEIDRAALDILDDGYFHAYDDGKYSGNFVIVKGSLTYEDEATRAPGQPYRFSMTLIEWK